MAFNVQPLYNGSMRSGWLVDIRFQIKVAV